GDSLSQFRLAAQSRPAAQSRGQFGAPRWNQVKSGSAQCQIDGVGTFDGEKLLRSAQGLVGCSQDTVAVVMQITSDSARLALSRGEERRQAAFGNQFGQEEGKCHAKALDGDCLIGGIRSGGKPDLRSEMSSAEENPGPFLLEGPDL